MAGSEEKENVCRALERICEKFREEKVFYFDKFIGYMERVFAENGYRDKGNQKNTHNILILTDSGVGDFIQATPAIKEVRRIYPRARITLLIYPRATNLALGCPYVDEVIPVPQIIGVLPLEEQLKYNIEFVKDNLLDKRFDVAFIFNNYFHSVLLAYMSGAVRRIGEAVTKTDFWGGVDIKATEMLLTDRGVPDTLGDDVSYADCFLGILDEFKGVPVDDRKPEIWYKADDRVVADVIAETCLAENLYCIAIGIGGTRASKFWPVDRYAEMANSLLDTTDKNALFIIFGGPDNKDEGDVLEKSIKNKRAINLAGITSFRQSAAVMDLCDRGYIGNDTSTLHMMAALGKPVLVVNAYSADKPLVSKCPGYIASPLLIRTKGVPAVVVVPDKAADECVSDNSSSYGCIHTYEPHCINGVKVDAVVHGWRLLQDNVKKGIKEHQIVYYSEDNEVVTIYSK